MQLLISSNFKAMLDSLDPTQSSSRAAWHLPLNRARSTSDTITRQLKNRAVRWEIKLSPPNCALSLKEAEGLLVQEDVCCVFLKHAWEQCSREMSQIKRTSNSSALASTCAETLIKEGVGKVGYVMTKKVSFFGAESETFFSPTIAVSPTHSHPQIDTD